MNRTAKLCIAAMLAITNLTVASNARGAIGDIIVSPSQTLAGQVNRVNVGEIEVAVDRGGVQPDWLYTAYFVDVVDPTTSVAAFAVSGGATAHGSHAWRAYSTLMGWSGQALRPQEWDSGFEFMIGGTTSVTTNSLGTAADLFGHDPAIFLFYIAEGSNLLAEPDHDQDEDSWFVDPVGDPLLSPFVGTTLRRSEFVALDINGRVVDFSVPEPGTLTIAAVALISLATRRMKLA